MTKRKAPPLGPIERGGVALPFLNLGFRMTIHDREIVAPVAAALRQLPRGPHSESHLIGIAPTSLAAKLAPFNPDVDDPIDWGAAELTRSIQAGIFKDQVPEYDRLTDKQKLAQLDQLDAAISQLDEAFGELRHETWADIRSVRPDLPPSSTIVRNGIYYLWRDEKERPWHPLHEAVREARRRLQGSVADRGSRPNGPAVRAVDEASKIYQCITGKAATVYWDDAAGDHKGECLPFMIEIFRIFGIDGSPTHYLKQDPKRRPFGRKN